MTLPTSVTTPPRSSASTTTSAMWSGGTATTVSCAAPVVGRGPPGAETAGRAHVLVVGVGQPDLEAGPRGGQTDRGAEQPGADDVDRAASTSSFIGHRPHPGEVAAQRRGAVQVDVGDVLARSGRSRRAPSSAPRAASSRSISSSRAQIRGTSSKPSWRAAYAGNSECRSEVAVKMMLMKSSTSSVVGLHHAAHHLGDPVEHVLAGVGLELGGSRTARTDTLLLDRRRWASADAYEPAVGSEPAASSSAPSSSLVELAQLALLQPGAAAPARSGCG